MLFKHLRCMAQQSSVHSHGAHGITLLGTLLMQTAHTHYSLMGRTLGTGAGVLTPEPPAMCSCAFSLRILWLGSLYLGVYTCKASRSMIFSHSSFPEPSLFHLLCICSSLPLASFFF